jgi:hypothetical protein
VLSFLDMINHWLGYFNINAKLKNRIYIIIAFLGDLYLIYVTTRLLINHAWVRGLLYCLAVILITYCLYINAVYYYLDRNSRFDFLSPWLSKITGVVPTAEDAKPKRNARVINNAPNGYFTHQDIIPAQVEVDEHEQHNLQRVVQELLDDGIFTADYDGLSDSQIVAETATGEPVYALDSQQTPPYFELYHDKHLRRIEIYMGLNQMEKLAVGHIAKVGLTDIHTAHEQYELYLANLFVTGGPHKIAGRNGSTILMDGQYGLVANVAYRDREKR